MEKYSKEGMLNRPAAVAIKRGQICKLNTNGKLELATAASTGLLCVAQWDVGAEETLAARIIGASAGTSVCECAAGTYTVGGAVYLAANGQVASTGTVAIGYYLGEAGTTTVVTNAEIALIAPAVA